MDPLLQIVQQIVSFLGTLFIAYVVSRVTFTYTHKLEKHLRLTLSLSLFIITSVHFIKDAYMPTILVYVLPSFVFAMFLDQREVKQDKRVEEKEDTLTTKSTE